MKKLSLLFSVVTTALSLSATPLTNDEKTILAQEKLAFIDSQKQALEEINFTNKCIYKQAQSVAAYLLKDDYATIKQQVKSAVTQIVSSQECIEYHHYRVMITTPLIGRDHIKAKNLPIIRPNQAFAKKVNDILASTIPVAFLGHTEVLTYFESYLNYKMDLIDSHFMVTKLALLEKEIHTFLSSQE